jgi:hypothetical protein
MRIKIAILFLFFIAGHIQGQDRAPKYSNEFMAIGIGARGLAMSGSQVAHITDITSAYWNPAGLTGLSSDFEASLMHAEYFAGIAKYDYAGFGVRVDSLSTFAASVIRFGVDDIPDTRFLYDANGAINYDRIRFFSAADYAFMLSYAREIPQWDGLRLGANVKVIHRIAGDFASAWGFGIDLGAQYRLNQWQFGLMLQDITGTFNAWSHNASLVESVYVQTGNEIPQNSLEVTLPKMILGVARNFTFSNFNLLVSADLLTTFDGRRNTLISSDPVSVDPALGLEIGYKRTAYVRFGMGDYQEIKDFDGSVSGSFQPNFGIGARLNNVRVDYALTDIGNQAESLYSHVFSISISFNRK